MTDLASRRLVHDLDLAIGLVGIGRWSWDLAGTVEWSDELCTMFRLPPGGFDGTFDSFVATISEDDRPRVLQTIQQCVAERSRYEIEYRHVRADGTEGWLRGLGAVLLDPVTGTPVALCGVAIDITDQRLREDELRHQRDGLARLLAERSTVQRMLQRTLVPPTLPIVEGLRVSAAFAPAGAELTGDFYDLFALEDGASLLCIGDVAGHGPEAAILTGTLRRAMQAAALTAPDPCAVLRSANGVHRATVDDVRLATAQVVHLRPVGCGRIEATIATAGHPPLLLRRTDGSVAEVTADGAALGLFPHPDYEATTLLLEPGDVLVATTDGLAEARPPSGGPRLGDQPVRDAAAALVPPIDPDCADTFIDLARRHSQGELGDDVAVVALEVAVGFGCPSATA